MTLPFRPILIGLTDFYLTIELEIFSQSAFPRVDANSGSKRGGVSLEDALPEK